MKVADLNIERVFFLGVGGIGMSAIARYFNSKGVSVLGYDRTETPLTQQLISEGVVIYYEDDISRIPENIDLVVFTPAIPDHNAHLKYFEVHGFRLFKRAEILGMLSENNFTIAIGGTHGKTTTTAMTAHILRHSGYGCNAFVGGIMTNYDSNYLEDIESEVIVVEADEFDRSFLHLQPDLVVLTSVDSDHLDIYGSGEQMLEGFKKFLACLKDQGRIYIHQDVKETLDCPGISYGSNKTSDIFADNLSYTRSHSQFSIEGELSFASVELPMVGRYNIMNALAAISIAKQLGIADTKIAAALLSFKGIKRRYEIHFNSEELLYIDDYAHHPTEITAFVGAVRASCPGANILGIFQPHLFSRTRDFMKEFATSFADLDELWLLPIYPAREEPLQGITSDKLLELVNKKDKRLMQKNDVLEALGSADFDIVLTIGAGDIDRLVEPIKEQILKKYA